MGLQPQPRRRDAGAGGALGHSRSSSLILVASSFLLARTRLGRYIYAIGASPEAARRAGINVARIRTIAFALCSFTAGLAAVAYASRLGSISVGFDGGTYVLYAVAAAVIGGASLFGGYGKPIHPLLGGLVIATLTNGLALLNITHRGHRHRHRGRAARRRGRRLRRCGAAATGEA